MKTGIVPYPSSDWQDRLWAFFRLDVGAYHTFFGAPAAGVTLIAMYAAPAYAAWIGPGACENHFGYWHLPGVRMVYRDHGVRSFAIASLISWRSQWYIVHLGPNPRPVNVGTVASPSLGAGTPGPPGGC